jgi:hypothetical protein
VEESPAESTTPTAVATQSRMKRFISGIDSSLSPSPFIDPYDQGVCRNRVDRGHCRPPSAASYMQLKSRKAHHSRAEWDIRDLAKQWKRKARDDKPHDVREFRCS